jgi:carboxyl-terminal processing protease
MKFRSPSLPLSLLLSALLLGAGLQARPDRSFTISPAFSLEIRTLIKLLEEAHYNREAVKPESYSEVIPNYMTDLDGQRLFFLASDKEHFERQYSGGLYWNVASLGDIAPAFDIFRTYEKRAEARVQWIFTQLDAGDFDLESKDTYNVDRSKAAWPASAQESDDLWRRRLKFEILQELLNEKSVDDAKATVRKRYERMLKNLADIDSNDLGELFLANIAKLYDPHSTYFSADTYEDFGIQMRLQLVGIGALLGLEDDYCVVKEVIAGGPADVDGRLKPNDKIIAVAQDKGEPVEVLGMKLRKIVDLIRGDKGTRVRLLVQPAAAPDPSVRQEIVLTRNLVNLDSARAHAAIFDIPDHEGNIAPIGVITLPAFYGADSSSDPSKQNSASKDVKELIDRLKAAGVQGLVLDLRDNGGGLLSEAIELTGLFIQSGPVVQVKSYYGEVKVDSDEDNTVAYTGPLAVLVSRFSASASEIVAGALQNYGRAIVLGDTSTHGKGTVQTVVEMRNLLNRHAARQAEKTGATKLTIQKFYLPSGSSTQRRGVIPDIVLPSIENHLPTGEKDLPHALVWDEIPTSMPDGQPLDPQILQPLREASLRRQATLEEFAYLQESINWFTKRQEQKSVSLNLVEREQQKIADKEFRKRMEAERDRLAATNYNFREFLLAPKPPRNKRAEPTEAEAEGEQELLTEGDKREGYARLDIHLREAMRVLLDAVEIGRNPQMWVADHAPLTAQLISDKSRTSPN